MKRHFTTRRLRGAVVVKGSLLAVPLLCVFVYLRSHREPHADVPALRVPTPNGFDLFVAAGKIAEANHNLCPYSMPAGAKLTPAQQAAHERALAPALKLVKQGLQRECVNTSGASWDNHTRFVDLSTSMAAIAKHRAEQKKYDEALDIWLDGIDAAARYARGGDWGAHTFTFLALQVLNEELMRCAPGRSSAQLRRAHERLAGIDRRWETSASILRRDGWSKIEGDLRSMRDKSALGGLGGIHSMMLSREGYYSYAGATPAPPDAHLAAGLRTAQFWMADKQDMLDANSAYYQAYADALERAPDSVPDVPCPNNEMSCDQRFSLLFVHSEQALWRILRVRIAVLLFRAERGRLPSTLVELTPAYLPSVPPDPFGGRPLQYGAGSKNGEFHVRSRGIDESGSVKQGQVERARAEIPY